MWTINTLQATNLYFCWICDGSWPQVLLENLFVKQLDSLVNSTVLISFTVFFYNILKHCIFQSGSQNNNAHNRNNSSWLRHIHAIRQHPRPDVGNACWISLESSRQQIIRCGVLIIPKLDLFEHPPCVWWWMRNHAGKVHTLTLFQGSHLSFLDVEFKEGTDWIYLFIMQPFTWELCSSQFIPKWTPDVLWFSKPFLNIYFDKSLPCRHFIRKTHCYVQISLKRIPQIIEIDIFFMVFIILWLAILFVNALSLPWAL